MSVDAVQLHESIRLAKAKADSLQFSFSAEVNQTDRVQCIWLERDIFFCEIFILLDSEFVDFSILRNGDMIEFDSRFEQTRIVSEKIATILNFLERAVTKG